MSDHTYAERQSAVAPPPVRGSEDPPDRTVRGRLLFTAMPTINIRIRPHDWERPEWRKQFEEDLLKVGWRVMSVEPPSRARAEYLVTLERPEADASPALDHGITPR